MSVASVTKQRKPLRSAFTKVLNEIEIELANDVCDVNNVEALYARLQTRLQKLTEADAKMQQVMEGVAATTDKELEDENDKVNEYLDQFSDVEAKVFAKTKKTKAFDAASSGSGSRPDGKSYRLPKLELTKFSGDPKGWLCFWSQFEAIHNNKGLSPQEKYQYLIQSTVENSNARIVVESLPPTAENYPKAVEYLKQRFGKDDVLVEIYTRELIKLVLQKNKEKGSITSLYDQLETQLKALETFGVKTENTIAILYPLVESALPDEILRIWERHRVSLVNPTEDKLTSLMSFLRVEVDSEQRINMAKSSLLGQDKAHSSAGQRKNKGQDESVPTAMGLYSGHNSAKKKECVFCEKNHSSSECHAARDMPLEQKEKIVKEKKACFHCLQRGHFSRGCKWKPKCLLCDQTHCVIMCPNSPRNSGGRSSGGNGGGATGGNNGNSSVGGQVSLASYCSTGVLLQTLEVMVYGDNFSRSVRVLLDTGSQHSYISKKAADVIGLKKKGSKKLTHILFGGQQTREKNHGVFDLKLSKLEGNFSKVVSVLDQDTICGSVSSVPDGPWISELREAGIKVTDIDNQGRDIHLLLGSDVLGEIFTGNMFRTLSGPVAMETVFGWTLMGRCHEGVSTRGSAMVVTSLHTSAFDFQDLWRLDLIGINDPVETKSKEVLTMEAQEHFEKTVRVNEDGRYEVSLPWIEGHPPVAQNRHIAQARVKSTYKKLQEKQKLTHYQKVFDEWEVLGVIEKVGEDEEIGKSYLPHRAVIKESSATTPIRPVFNASAQSEGLPSLNDCLEKGPNLIELLPDVVIQFRRNRYGILSDIKKAFLMISLKPEDREFVRFLWWEGEKLQEYRPCRVVFGVSSSPFLLAATLNHHLKKFEEEEPEVVKALRKSLYVDNSGTSFDTEEELVKFMETSTRILAEAKMELRGWEWSWSVQSLHSNELSTVVPVLGMFWDKRKDTLQLDCSGFVGNEEEPQACSEVSKVDLLSSRRCGLGTGLVEGVPRVTKRLILSDAHKIFDLVGVTCPVTLVPKLQLQELWTSKVGWDEEVPDEIARRFLKWKKELPRLQQLEIPRWMAGGKEDKRSLHTFTDASKAAYSACVFIRVESSFGVQVQLVSAKSRVASTKKMSIPRLELLGCCIGARLTSNVAKALDIEDIPITYWTDSCNALFWIQRTENWATFVWNRVQEVRRLSDALAWRHVAGELNPADLPSRGCSASQLVESRWWEGPDWLYLPEDKWPRSQVDCDMEIVLAEKKKSVVSHAVTEGATWYLRYFSTYRKLVRMLAWILRWRNKTKGSSITVEEEEKAEMYLLRLVQKESFHEKDLVLKQLHAVKDEFGLWRVETKIIERDDFRDFRFPVLLPGNHKITKMLLKEVHLKKSHCGTQVLLSCVRERFWIPKSRRVVREVINGCVRCRRQQVKRSEAVEAPLPLDRIRDSAVFEVTGVDLGGPLYLKNKEKVWFAVFTCAVFRAVHLEVVSSLSTEGFIMAFRRFVARRGRPSTIRSDHGTNFEGTNNAMGKLDWKAIEEETAVQRIRWTFNPPSAPWWGGWWERLVGMVKDLLRRNLGRASLTYEELETVLCDVEEVCNSRPLTYVAEEAEDLVQLTPSMFLMDVRTCGVPDLDGIDGASLNRRVKFRQQLRQDLRERFRSEYLGKLVHHNHVKKTSDLQVGEVVLVGDDNRKRIDWRMGRILVLHPGRDGVERVATVKTVFGEITRPVQRLYPLEMRAEDPLCEKAGQVARVEQNEEQAAVKRTRSGRVIKMPERYMN